VKRLLRVVQSRAHRPEASVGVESAAFDAGFYRRLNPDLADLPDDAALEAHWRAHGRSEGRPGSLAAVLNADEAHLGALPDDFDVEGYRTHNPDLAALETSPELVAHYLRHGRQEGRRYYAPLLPDTPSLAALTAEAERHPQCVAAL
jgi:hypothetical protein